MKKLKTILLAYTLSLLATTATVLFTLRLLAQTPALRVIGQETAVANTTNIPVWAGRFTAIDFFSNQRNYHLYSDRRSFKHCLQH